jgi:hypothetical protein
MPPPKAKKHSSVLGKLLSREKGALPSIINLIDQQNLKPEVQYSQRLVNLRLNEFKEALRTKGKHGAMTEFALLYDAYTASDSRDVDNIHPSELMSACSRAMYYRVTDTPKTNKSQRKIDARTMRTFDLGKWCHLYIQNLLYKAGVLKTHEAPFHNKELRFIGSADGILWFELNVGDVHAILEVKTINDYGFRQVVAMGDAKLEHVFQASTYAKELKCDYIYFLYFNKNTSELFERVYEAHEFKETQTDAYNKIYTVWDAIDNNDVPKRVCKSPLDTEALACAYCNHCFNLK